MRSPSARNSSNLLFLFLSGLTVWMVFSSLRAERRKSFLGTWQYTSVTKNGVSLFSIGPNDTMILRGNGTFQYDLENPNRHSSGIWKYESGGTFPADQPQPASGPMGSLRFTYLKDSSIRTFYITVLTDSTLEFYEKGVFFGYKRRR